MANTNSKPVDTGGAAEVQSAADEAAEKGYIGHSPDPFPSEAYSLRTGPDSPTAAETRRAMAAPAETKDKEASK